ncbi:hypothetical protein JHW43_001182 [Diplocarpon mali]|nr:hypothetical protein JHW43_001182 [Diplocarpon mali]
MSAQDSRPEIPNRRRAHGGVNCSADRLPPAASSHSPPLKNPPPWFSHPTHLNERVEEECANGRIASPRREHSRLVLSGFARAGVRLRHKLSMSTSSRPLLHSPARPAFGGGAFTPPDADGPVRSERPSPGGGEGRWDCGIGMCHC